MSVCVCIFMRVWESSMCTLSCCVFASVCRLGEDTQDEHGCYRPWRRSRESTWRMAPLTWDIDPGQSHSEPQWATEPCSHCSHFTWCCSGDAALQLPWPANRTDVSCAPRDLFKYSVTLFGFGISVNFSMISNSDNYQFSFGLSDMGF